MESYLHQSYPQKYLLLFIFMSMCKKILHYYLITIANFSPLKVVNYGSSIVNVMQGWI